MPLWFLIPVVVCAAFLLEGCSNKNSKTKDEETFNEEDILEGIEEDETMSDKLIVDGAKVACTSMVGGLSITCMKKESGGVVMQGALELDHKDIEFEPLFEKCQYSVDEACLPEIENQEWQAYDESHTTGDGYYALLKDESYMFCSYGCGIIYITEDGQKVNDMEVMAAEILFHKWWNNEYLGGGRIKRNQIEAALTLLDKNGRLPDVTPYIDGEQLSAMGYFEEQINLYMVADLNRMLEKYDITTTERMRHFFAQCMEESTAIKSPLPIEKGSEDYLKDKKYWPYYGAGYIQLTGKAHYKCFAIYAAKSAYQEDLADVKYRNPNNSGSDLIDPQYEKMLKIAEDKGLDISEYTRIYELGEGSPEYVAYEFGWETAGYFWDIGKTNETVDSFVGGTDKNNVEKITDLVNSGTGSREKRRNHYVDVQDIIK